MPTYRVEIATTGRAGCQATDCKKAGIKIAKGELRQGSWVEIKEHGSWRWRHWGCITPTVIHNWWEAADGQLDMIDGYDDLPDEVQEKVQRALEQGHVDDDDWKGDLELNRFNPGKKSQGMFLKKSKKSEASDEKAEEAESSPPKKKSSSKKRKVEEVDEADEKPATKKKTVKAGGRGKRVAEPEDSEDADVKAPPSKPKKSSGKKSKAATQEDQEVVSEPKPDSKPASKKGRAKKAAPPAYATSDEEDRPVSAAKTRKGRTRKSSE